MSDEKIIENSDTPMADRQRDEEIALLEEARAKINAKLEELARKYAKAIGDSSVNDGVKNSGNNVNDWYYWQK